MFCKKCGNQLSDDAAFCSKCGALVGEDAAPVQQPVAPAQPEPVAAPVQPVQQNIPTPPPVQQTVPPVIPVEAAQSASAPKEDKKKKLIIAIVGGVVGLIILIVIIASVAGKGSSSDNQSVDNQYYEESVEDTTDSQIETTASSASGDFDSNDPFDEGTEDSENPGSYKYDNPKTYKDKTIILDGKKVTLPCTVQEFYDATGYNVSLPDNQVEANYKYYGVDLTKGEKKVNCDVINTNSSPKAYKDCTIVSIGAYYSEYNEYPKLELPCGLKLGEKATINGVVNNLGAPMYYITDSENAGYYTIEYGFEKGNNTYDGKLSITISDGKVSNFDVSVGH